MNINNIIYIFNITVVLLILSIYNEYEYPKYYLKDEKLYYNVIFWRFIHYYFLCYLLIAEYKKKSYFSFITLITVPILMVLSRVYTGGCILTLFEIKNYDIDFNKKTITSGPYNEYLLFNKVKYLNIIGLVIFSLKNLVLFYNLNISYYKKILYFAFLKYLYNKNKNTTKYYTKNNFVEHIKKLTIL